MIPAYMHKILAYYTFLNSILWVLSCRFGCFTHHTRAKMIITIFFFVSVLRFWLFIFSDKNVFITLSCEHNSALTSMLCYIAANVQIFSIKIKFVLLVHVNSVNFLEENLYSPKRNTNWNTFTLSYNPGN